MSIQKKSVALLSILSLVSSLLGLVFSVVLARCYGVSRDVEIYFAASSLFFVIASLTQTGSITEIALPIYHRHVEEYGKKEALKLYCLIINWMGLAAFATGLVSALFAGPIVRGFVPGFTPADQETARIFFLWISPLFMLEILKSIMSTLLNAEKVFGRTELANVFSQLGNILFIIIFHKTLGAFAAMMGLWFGQILSLGYSLYLANGFGFRYHFIWRDNRFSLRELFLKIQNTFSYAIATQFYAIGFNAAISLLPQGQYGIFKYATLIFSKTQGLLLHPVSVVFFSQFSKEFVKGISGAGRLIVQSNRITFLSGIAVVTVVFSIGLPSFCLIWLNEKFDFNSIEITYRMLLLLYCLLFANGIALIYRKVNMAFGWVKELYLSMSVVNVAFGILMYFWPARLVGLWYLVGVSLSNITLMALIPPALVAIRRRDAFELPDSSFWVKSGLLLSFSLAAVWVFKFWLYSQAWILAMGWAPVILISGLFSLGILSFFAFVLRLEEFSLLSGLIRKNAARFF